MGGNRSNSGNLAWYFKFFMMLIVIGAVAFAFFVLNDKFKIVDTTGNITVEESAPYSRSFLPSANRGTIIYHPHFAISYSEQHEQAEWVAYEMDIPRLKGKVDRNFNFRSDPDIPTGSAAYNDYRGSGYDRGHLVPAADMASIPDAVNSTFMMSNISPQAPHFNRGIWRELEEQVRDWTRKNKHLYIITGPVLSDQPGEVIGLSSNVAVPKMFFKVLLDYTGPEKKTIGFVLPNEKSDLPISQFATTVDEVERLTGIDFFPNLPDREEERLESSFKMGLWPVNDFWTKLRIEHWNNYGD